MLMSTTPSESVMSARPSVIGQNLENPRRHRTVRAVAYLPIIMALTVIFCLIIIISVLVLIFSKKASVKTRNYCDPQLCRPGLRHTACWPTAANCSGFEVFNLTEKDQDNILSLHNECRRDVAVRIPAADMRKLIWDDELSYLALVHGKRCEMQTDQCRNTERFGQVGQNIFIHHEFDTNTAEEDENDLDYPERCYKHAIRNWCLQGRRVGKSTLKNYREYEKTEIRNFIQLARDATRRVGCAVVRFNGIDDTIKICLTICNYDEGPTYGEDVLSVGRTCFLTPLHRKCEDGLSD